MIRCREVLRQHRRSSLAVLAQVPGQTESFLQHMQLGVGAAADDPTALLVFSGGQTREAAGARSEAQSYRNVAQAAGWFSHPEVRSRVVTEVGGRRLSGACVSARPAVVS